MKRIAVIAFLLGLASPAWAGLKVSGHPLVKPYTGSRAWKSDVVQYTRFAVPTGKFSWDGTLRRDVPASSVVVRGKLTAIEYKTPKKRSVLEIQENYEQALRQGGFRILFSCLGRDCSKRGGPARFKTSWLHQITLGADYSGLISAKLERPDGDVYVVIATDQHNAFTNMYVIEAKPMQTGMVKVDADALLKDIDRTGHAAIYGIYFDTNKAEVKPESKQALGEIAKLLNSRPKLKLYVVGHTDNVGTLEYNMDLSRRRAAAVVAVLVKDYGIARARLHPAGVGPLSPVLANSSDAGRAKNRRVELVAQ
jgi:outer membrane protein OmpA-like peptidoglycan-associated protein